MLIEKREDLGVLVSVKSVFLVKEGIKGLLKVGDIDVVKKESLRDKIIEDIESR